MEGATPKAALTAIQAGVQSRSLTLEALNNLYIPLYSGSRKWTEGFFASDGIEILNAAMTYILEGDMYAMVVQLCMQDVHRVYCVLCVFSLCVCV